MKQAIKVLCIIFIILNTIAAIFLIAGQGLFKEFFTWSYEHGYMKVDGEPATEEEYEIFIMLIPIIVGICVFAIICSTVVLAINLHYINNENQTAILVIGIVHFVFGNALLGILNIVYYVLNNQTPSKPINHNNDTVTFE